MIIRKENTSNSMIPKLMVAISLLLLCVTPTYAEEDEKPEDFVIASIIVADPYDNLYSCVGHCALHMRCPDFDLDYVFSYESEDAKHHVLKFLAGNLKMGMFAIPTEEYLEFYKKDGRGVKEYTLNLPINVKRELWRVLDNHVAEGIDLPYDYLNRGCAHSVLMMIEEALGPTPIVFGPWPEKFDKMTRREITEMQVRDYPWNKCFLHILSNGEIDRPCSRTDKLIMPADLIDVLEQATVSGKQLLSPDYTVLITGTNKNRKVFITPLLLAILLLCITIFSVIFPKKKHFSSAIDYTLLTVQTIIGTVSVYLVLFSNLVCTEWSWLIIPFNPLPLIIWHWRKYWSRPYAIIIFTWTIAVVCANHRITDLSLIILSLALAIDYFFCNKKFARPTSDSPGVQKN